MRKLLLSVSLIFSLLSCYHEGREFNGPAFGGSGYRPVYVSEAEAANIQIGAPQQLSKPGKIYVREPYLFINESGKGVHIINNADPAHPDPESFISIPGNYDMAVKGEFLYVDNLSNLLVFSIRDPEAPRLVKKVANAIPVNSFPPYQNVYFECVDKSKGIVVGWEKVSMDKPKCYR